MAPQTSGRRGKATPPTCLLGTKTANKDTTVENDMGQLDCIWPGGSFFSVVVRLSVSLGVSRWCTLRSSEGLVLCGREDCFGGLAVVKTEDDQLLC